jgi:hypothetical protein
MGQRVFVGLDWAEDHHDVYIENDRGDRLGGGRLPEGVEGVARFHEWVARHVDEAADAVVATETDRGLFIGALVAAGYRVLAVNRLSTSRYRERHSTSGAKSDPVMPRCWPIWPAPTPTIIAPSPVTASSVKRSRCWLGPINR